MSFHRGWRPIIACDVEFVWTRRRCGRADLRRSEMSPWTRTERNARYPIGRLVLDEMDRQHLSRADLTRRLGYRNITKGIRRLETLLRSGDEPTLIPKIAA